MMKPSGCLWKGKKNNLVRVLKVVLGHKCVLLLLKSLVLVLTKKIGTCAKKFGTCAKNVSN